VIIEIPIDVWDPARGGAEGYLLRLCRGLLSRGHRVRILCRRSNPAFEDEVEVEKLPVPSWPRWRRELAFARKVLAWRREGSGDITLAVRHTLEADVYQPHGGPFSTAVRASLAWRRPGALGWMKGALRRLRPTTRVLLWLDREILRRSESLITISLSRKVEEDFRRAYPGVRFEFERIHNGVDLREFHDRDREDRALDLRRRFGIPRGRRMGLFVGRRFGPKGLLDAVRALPSLPALHLVVLGAGREGKFKRAACSLGVSNRLHFAGFSENPREYYAAADVLIHPTFYDPCSLSVLEALACGVPVITTTANGAGELITLGREGFVLEPGDVAGIAAAAEQIFRDWENFHTSARERARDLSFESHLARVEEVLIRAAMRRPRK